MNITIFGAGAFGTALGKVLSDNGHAITYYDIICHISLEQACQNAEALIFAVPSTAISKLIHELPEYSWQLPAIIASKGLFALSSLEPLTHLCILSGPAFASDLKTAKNTVLTASNPIAQELLANHYLKIELSDDALGVMLCGTLKNIYAIGAGLFTSTTDELSSYLESAHQELKKYLENSGAKPATADLSCGIGDLTLTATSSESRNLQCGKLLASGQSLQAIKTKLGTIEGLRSLKLAQRDQYPIIQKIYQGVFKQNA